ncbi:MAG: hypothetical protein M3297_13230 [Thermoproteota archaeon]|nr:hypothetical protein [Thermoproteota archaeon]
MQYSETESIGSKTPHEYIREILPFRYQECISCGNRTDLTCMRCGYCYSCHWKKEKEERRLLDDKISKIFSPSSLISNRKNQLIEKEAKEEEQQQSLPEQKPQQHQHQHQQLIVVDVYGKTSEPICTFHGCDHKFSAHGLSNCKCKHPTNKTIGVFTKYP